MFKLLLGGIIKKKGGARALLFLAELIVKITKSKEDDKMLKKIKPIIKKFL
tara:strand:+ start:112 stop:264 length:153 start_codon:yes stop_codon:yes gene_type:complete